MDEMIRSILLEIISQIDKEYDPNRRVENNNSQSSGEQSSHSHNYNISLQRNNIDMLPVDLYSSPNFVAEDIFSDLNAGEGIDSNLTTLSKVYNYSEIATQTSQSLLGHFSDSTAQTSQTLMGSGHVMASPFFEDQIVPVSVPQIEAYVKIRRIGLSKRARTNPLHKLSK